MFKKMEILIVTLLLSFFSISNFAFGPGAGQAQVRNNMQTLQQNKQQMQRAQQMKQNQIQKQRIQRTPKVPN